MYVQDQSFGIMTIPSLINNNLALCDSGEHATADSLAVIHEGYVNYIPIVRPERRAKYVGLYKGPNRGKGQIKQVLWLKLRGETWFIILSTCGLLVYDAEICDLKYSYPCREMFDVKGYAIGACVVKDNFLCVGSSAGIIWTFYLNIGGEFSLIERTFAHESPITVLVGNDDSVVTSAEDKTTYLWDVKKNELVIRRSLKVFGLNSICTTIKLNGSALAAGYESGEICIFDTADENQHLREAAHKLGITQLDISSNKNVILTGSSDCYVKIWSYDFKTNKMDCIFSFFNEDGPVYGVGFLNANATNFCIVTEGMIEIKQFVRTDKD